MSSADHMLRSYCSLTVLLLSVGITGCGGQDLPVEDAPYENSTYSEAYMLYLEEIIPPEVIYEDERSEFQLRVSADYNPDALKGLSHERWTAVTGYFRLYWNPQERWMLDAFVSTEIDPQAEPSDILPLAIPGMPVGEWVVVIRCAAERSLGGRKYKYYRTPSPGPVVPAEELQEIRFTVNVVPRPEE